MSQVVPWLQAIGFGWAEEKPITFWMSANSLGLGPEDVVVFYARWRPVDSFVGRPYPLSLGYRWTKGLGAKNLDVTVVIRRRDLRVISVRAVMIRL